MTETSVIARPVLGCELYYPTHSLEGISWVFSLYSSYSYQHMEQKRHIC